MHVELTLEQRDLLLQLVDEAVREIGPEIRHSDSREYRDDLKQRRVDLRVVHAVLAGQAREVPESPSAGLVGTP